MTISDTASDAPCWQARRLYGAQLMPAMGAAITGGHRVSAPMRKGATCVAAAGFVGSLSALAGKALSITLMHLDHGHQRACM